MRESQTLNRMPRFGLLLTMIVAACGGDYGDDSVGGNFGEIEAANGIVSDDFHSGALDTQVWQVVDPQGDGNVSFVGAGTSDAQMLLSVPAGTDHDAWTSNTALRVMQPANDDDFEIEVKFDSQPTQQYQSQGLIVQQDPSNYVRFDVYSTGGALRAFAAAFTSGSPNVHANDSIPSSGTTYLRLGRSGNQWTAQYSSNGTSWTTAASFSQALTVSAVGPFAGNFNPAPAFTAAVDYFYDTSAPIVAEDPPLCDPAAQLVLTTQAANGTILRSPDQATYGCGEVVTLTAQPDPGATFLGWGGALSGTANPTTVTMNADTTVSASFDIDVSPPQISNVNAIPGETSATVSWQTDEASIGAVAFGLTTAYELGSVASSTLSTAHAVTLPGLAAGQLYHYRVTAEDSLGNGGAASDATFTTSTGGGGPNPSGIVSDDFHTGVLDTQVWQVVDPQADGTVGFAGAGTPDARLLLSVPAGSDHDAWTNNTALRVMQPANDDDFEIEVKFESSPTQAYQSQGLLVQQDASNYVRFDVYSSGGSLNVFTAAFSNGSPSIYSNDSIPALGTTYLRLGRSGNQWTAQYSSNGTSWTTAASFSRSLTVSAVGPFAGNFSPAPAFTAVVDYFFDTAAPILSEDPPLCDPADPLVLTTLATNGTIARSPNQATYSCGDVVTLTAQPDFGATFLGWGGALNGTANPTTVTMNADTSVTAAFDLDITPPQVTNVGAAVGETSATVSWQTNELSVGLVEYGLTTAYELGSVASSTLSTAHAVTLPGLVEGETYHYRVTVEDSFGNSAAGIDRNFTTTSATCVLTTQASNGTILRSPNAGSYPCGTIVTLTAQPNTGATFVGWGGALSGTASPTTVTVDADITVTATFDLDVLPPQISGVNATAGETSATIGWQTDEASVGFVEYGVTTAYELGSIESTNLSTVHAVGLSLLLDGQTYHYRVTAEDAFGNGITTGDATFTTTTSGGGGGGAGGSGGAPGVLLSDDFSGGTLDTVLWDIVDPVGDGTVEVVGAGTQDAHLLLTVPSGNDHDAWSDNTSLRVMQPASDEDLEIEAKFESQPTQAYQSQGLLVEQDPTNYVRLDVYSSGGTLKVFAATFTNGTPDIHSNDTIPSSGTTYLRLGRSGNQWTAEYSSDGSSWSTAATFSQALTVSSAGVFAGNFNPAPAFTAVVDYFFDTSAPIDPEDGAACAPSDQFTVAATSVGPGTVDRSPNQSTYGCGEVVTLTAQPNAGAGFLGWGTPPSDTTNPLTITVNDDVTLTATFQLDQTPPQLSNVNAAVLGGSATISWETDEATTGFVEYGLTPSYELGSVPSGTSATTHAVPLTGLIEGQTYHYRVTAEDSAGNSTSSGDDTFITTTGGPNLDVWYGDSQSFGALGNPQRWVNVLGQVADPDGLSVLTFSLNGGPPQDLSIGPFRRLAEPGDFNVEIDYQDLSPGNNTIQIRAVDGIGFETVKTVNVSYTAGNVWPLGIEVDWSSANEISDVAQVVDGRWSIVGGELRNDLDRYDRLVAIGDLAWTDYEVTVPVTVHSIDPAGFSGVNGAPGVGLFLRWTGHFDWNGAQPTYGYYPIGGGGWLEFAANGDGNIRLEDFTPGGLIRFDPLQRIISIGTRYIWKIRVESLGGNTTRYSMKIWVDGTPEPSSWEIVGDETGDLPGGSVALVPHFADVSFGNVIIDPI